MEFFDSSMGIEFVNNLDSEWYCVRSQPKHEHIAAAHLRSLTAIEVFLPRIRFKRATKRGPSWATEALFPGYLFARFDLRHALRAVQSASGVQCVVRFGERWPTIPNPIIQEIMATIGQEDVRVIPDDFKPGETVLIADGPMLGLRAVVTRVMPGSERVAVLMEFLGQQTHAEVSSKSLVRDGEERMLQGF